MIDLNTVGAKGALVEQAQGKWGIVVDQEICTGCQACVVACAMENNIAFVGEEDSGYGRSMHWIRIERFWQGEYPNVQMTHYRPTMCQQCGKAPCEPVCPAYATMHSQSEQINLQVYNRCVGTRYCGNNCPYQVRSFNWRDYQDERLRPYVKTLKNHFNPDVTVRRRGVMEKCTFCLQRIRRAEDVAQSENRDLAEGEVTPACVQACPASAITFGRVDDPKSLVSQLKVKEHGAYLLEELGTLPRVAYANGGQV